MSKKWSKGIITVAVIAILLVFSILFSIRLFTQKTEGTVANIYQNGVCIYSVDLSDISEPYEVTIPYGEGYNIIQINQGCIAVKESDCPDGICVQTGWISDGVLPIVCLPHRLVIRLEKDSALSGSFDTVAE